MPAGGREKMRYIVNSREMNLYDSRTIEEFHMPQTTRVLDVFRFSRRSVSTKENAARSINTACGI